MKILIVSIFFPPGNSIAALRPYSWAKWWSRAGHEVTVLTTTQDINSTNLNLDCSGFKVIEVPFKVPLKKINNEVKDFNKNNSNESENKSQKNLKMLFFTFLREKYIKYIKNAGCFSACRFPDWHDLWIKKALKFVEPSSCDLLVTTGGSYCVHRTALQFKKKGWKGKWICDWRDLWTKNHLFTGLKIFRPYEKYLENKFHKNADFITTVSEPLADTLRSMTNTPVEVIYNGFDEEDFELLLSKERNKNSKYVISYLGTVYKSYQDPTPLFKAIAELDKEGLITSDDLVIQFAGDGANADVSDYAQKYGIEKYYKFLGFIPRDKSLELQYNSDAVLFLEYENPNVKGVLTGKLFEYLYVSRFIIAVGCSNKTSAGELIEKSNAGVCFGHNVEKIKNFILSEVKKKRTKEDSSEIEKAFSEIKLFSRKLQAEKLINLITN